MTLDATRMCIMFDASGDWIPIFQAGSHQEHIYAHEIEPLLLFLQGCLQSCDTRLIELLGLTARKRSKASTLSCKDVLFRSICACVLNQERAGKKCRVCFFAGSQALLLPVLEPIIMLPAKKPKVWVALLTIQVASRPHIACLARPMNCRR